MTEAQHRVIHDAATGKLIELSERVLKGGEAATVVTTSSLHADLTDYPITDFHLVGGAIVRREVGPTTQDSDYEERAQQARLLHVGENHTLASIIKLNLSQAALATAAGEHTIADQIYDALLKIQYVALSLSVHIQYMRSLGDGRHSNEENHRKAVRVAQIVAAAYFAEVDETDIFGIDSVAVRFRALNPVPARRQENLRSAVAVTANSALTWAAFTPDIFETDRLVELIEINLLEADPGLKAGRAQEARE